MRINVIGATVVCGIAFSTPGGALHAEFGESLAGRFRHKLLRKTVRGTSLVADDGVEFFHECRGLRRYSQLRALRQEIHSEQRSKSSRYELVRHS